MKTSSNHNSLRHSLLLVAFTAMFALSQFSVANAQGLQGDIQWLTNVEQAKSIARQENKLVLLHFDASWCRPCKALESYVFKSSQVKKSIAENVVPVKLDADRALDMVNEYDVSMVPFDVIITPDGRVVTERRSPADAENYAKMISGTSNASRNLGKENRGPIAHQHKFIKNNLVSEKDPLEFRSEGFGLSKDSSILQRRQTTFSDATNGGTPKIKSNPFVTPSSGQASDRLGSDDRASAPLAVDDLERNQFLAKERNWVAPSTQTRRVAPRRIINDRYFESIAEKEQVNNALLSDQVSSLKPKRMDSIAKSDKLELPAADNMYDLGLDSDTSNSTLSLASGEVDDSDDFKVKPSSRETTLSSVIEINKDDSNSLELDPNPPEIDRQKLCLKGKCPVTLITEGRWEDGDTRYGIVHRNRTYIFASAEKLAQFRSNPDNYSPVLAGYDPVVYHDQGQLIEGLVENGVFMGRTPNQKVILFKDAQTRSKFQSSPKEYLEKIRQATSTAGGGTLMR